VSNISEVWVQDMTGLCTELHFTSNRLTLTVCVHERPLHQVKSFQLQSKHVPIPTQVTQ
jgi:hypothetical protein